MSENKIPQNESIELLHKQLQAALEIPQRILNEISKEISKSLQSVTAQLQPILDRFAEEFRTLPARTRETLKILGEHGWYLDIHMSIPEQFHFAESIVRGDVEVAEKALASYYRERVSEMADALADWFPERTRILTAAFNAHGRGEYELAVPIFLAQADGICKKLLGTQLFKRHKGEPVTRNAIASRRLEYDTLEAALLHSFEIALPISASAEESSRFLNVLNRHEVLHGESLDYGTEMNSLKAISLLYYVASVLQDNVRKSA